MGHLIAWLVASNGGDPKEPNSYLPILKRVYCRDEEEPQSESVMRRQWDKICRERERMEAKREKT